MSFRKRPIKYTCVPCSYQTNSETAWKAHVLHSHPMFDPEQRSLINHADVAPYGHVAHVCPICDVELTGCVGNLVAHIDRKHPYDEIAPPYPDFVVDEVVQRFERQLAFEAYCQERRAA